MQRLAHAAEGSAVAHERWIVHCDASAVPNPGRMGLGAVLVAPDGSRHELSQLAEGRGCNNEAETRALMAALMFMKSRGVSAFLAYCDNSILVGQVTQAGEPPIERLAALFDEARAMLSGFDEARVQWIPRHRNREADALARAALGLPAKAAPGGPKSAR